MRVTRKILTAIAFGVLIIAMIIRIVEVAQVANLYGALAAAAGESGTAVKGAIIALVTFTCIFCGLIILLSGLGIWRCIAFDRPTKLIPWAFEIYQIAVMILLGIGLAISNIAAGSSGTTYTPDGVMIGMIVLLVASIVALIVNLCLAKRRIGFQVALMVLLAIALAFHIMNIVENTKGGAEVPGMDMTVMVMMIIAPILVFVGSFLGCFEKPVHHWKNRVQKQYDAYGYEIRQKKARPVYSDYGYENPRPQPQPKPQKQYDEYGYEIKQPKPQPRPQPRPVYDEFGYEVRPTQPKPAPGPRPAPVEAPKVAPQPAVQPRPAGNVDAAAELKKIKSLFDMGLISKEEYEAKRAKYLAML